MPLTTVPDGVATEEGMGTMIVNSQLKELYLHHSDFCNLWSSIIHFSLAANYGSHNTVISLFGIGLWVLPGQNGTDKEIRLPHKVASATSYYLTSNAWSYFVGNILEPSNICSANEFWKSLLEFSNLLLNGTPVGFPKNSILVLWVEAALSSYSSAIISSLCSRLLLRLGVSSPSQHLT